MSKEHKKRRQQRRKADAKSLDLTMPEYAALERRLEQADEAVAWEEYQKEFQEQLRELQEDVDDTPPSRKEERQHITKADYIRRAETLPLDQLHGIARRFRKDLLRTRRVKPQTYTERIWLTGELAEE